MRRPKMSFRTCSVRAYEHLDHLRDDQAIRPWLAQTTRRLCVDHVRSRRHDHPGELIESAEVDAVLETLDEALLVREALERLSPECQGRSRQILRTRRELPNNRRATRPGERHGGEAGSRVVCSAFATRWMPRTKSWEEKAVEPRLVGMKMMNPDAFSEERIAALLAGLRPAPVGWGGGRRRATAAAEHSRPARRAGRSGHRVSGAKFSLTWRPRSRALVSSRVGPPLHRCARASLEANLS